MAIIIKITIIISNVEEIIDSIKKKIHYTYSMLESSVAKPLSLLFGLVFDSVLPMGNVGACIHKFI